MKTSVLIFGFLLLTACSSVPYRKTLIAAGAGVAAGAIYGLTRPSFQNQNAMMYGAVGGLAATAYALVTDLDEVNGANYKAENENLKKQLDELQKLSQPKLFQKGDSLFSSPLPKEVAGLVEPGEWKRFKMDQWVQDPYQTNTWYRQVEMFEITPPSTK